MITLKSGSNSIGIDLKDYPKINKKILEIIKKLKALFPFVGSLHYKGL